MVLLEGECVSSLDHSPVPAVHLTMRDPTQGCKSPETQTTVSDAEGKFRFAPFPAGRRWIVTRSPTDEQTRRSLYPPTDHDVDPVEPGTLHLRIVLGEHGSVRGRVVDAETGSPVRDAQVALRGESALVSVQPTTGEFVLPQVVLRSRSQQIVASASGYASSWGVLRMGETGIDGMTLKMRRARTLAGTVRDAAGKPVPGIWVEIQGTGRTPFLAADGTPEFREDSPGRLDLQGGETDSLGHYQVEGLDPDFTWSVSIKSRPTEKEGMKSLPFRKEGLSAFSFGAGELVRTVDIVRVEGTSVRGTVVDERGEALPGGGILLCAASVVHEVMQGRPLLAIEPASDGGASKFRWADGASDQIPFLEELLEGHVRFREAHLRPVDREGKFAFDGVEPGLHLVFVRRKDHEKRTFLRQVGPDPVEWRIPLFKREEVVVSGRVLDPDGAPVGGAKVKAVGLAEEEGELGWRLAESTTTAEGTYSLRFQRGGAFRVEATHAARKGASAPVKGSSPSVEIRLR
jgi:protocatechuate 3,4-dioxygenase beta subunit